MSSSVVFIFLAPLTMSYSSAAKIFPQRVELLFPYPFKFSCGFTTLPAAFMLFMASFRQKQNNK